MPNINKEARIVDWLLQRYGLYDKRCRFMLRDLNGELEADLPMTIGAHTPASGRLTLNAFDCFFCRRYPVQLQACEPQGKPPSAITAQDLFTRIERTRLVREYDSLGSADVHGRPFALIFPWAYARDIGQSLVIHNRRAIDAHVAGPHFVHRFADGTVLILETLDVLLATVDSENPQTDWMAGAIRRGFDTPVEPKH